MLLCVCSYGVKSEISLDTGDSASNAVVKRSVFIIQRCAECVCLYTMDFVSASKNTLLLYVTVCEKVVSRLNKHDDVIELKIPLPEMKSWLRPYYRPKYICHQNTPKLYLLFLLWAYHPKACITIASKICEFFRFGLHTYNLATLRATRAPIL